MPFASEKQRAYLHANNPDLAQKWEAEAEAKGEAPVQPQRAALMRAAKRRLKRGK